MYASTLVLATSALLVSAVPQYSYGTANSWPTSSSTMSADITTSSDTYDTTAPSSSSPYIYPTTYLPSSSSSSSPYIHPNTYVPSSTSSYALTNMTSTTSRPACIVRPATSASFLPVSTSSILTTSTRTTTLGTTVTIRLSTGTAPASYSPASTGGVSTTTAPVSPPIATYTGAASARSCSVLLAAGAALAGVLAVAI